MHSIDKCPNIEIDHRSVSLLRLQTDLDKQLWMQSGLWSSFTVTSCRNASFPPAVQTKSRNSIGAKSRVEDNSGRGAFGIQLASMVEMSKDPKPIDNELIRANSNMNQITLHIELSLSHVYAEMIKHSCHTGTASVVSPCKFMNVSWRPCVYDFQISYQSIFVPTFSFHYLFASKKKQTLQVIFARKN